MSVFKLPQLCLLLLVTAPELSAQNATSRRTPFSPAPLAGDVKTVAAPLVFPAAPPKKLVDRTPASETTPAPSRERVATSIVSHLDPSIVYHSAGLDGSLWSRGADFKLGLDSSGATYVPFFGSRAPQDYPVHMALAGATVGGDPLAIDCGAAPVRSGDVVRFDRGAIDEVYEIAPEQLEQQFVIKRVPAVGELVLHVAIDTALRASATADGFQFANELGQVHCGLATAVDAHGRTLALESDLANGTMTIRVPASFVAQAAFPLVIDPLWFTVDLENGPRVSLSPDVAHANGGYLFVCWEDVYSASDHDVLAELVDGNGGLYSAFYLDSTTTNWTRPRAGHITAGDCVLVAAEVGPVGARSVWGFTVQIAQPYSPVISPRFEISEATASGEKFHPEVGGDPFPSTPSYFCVVYERAFVPSDHDILARLVDGNGVLGNTIWLENSFSTLDTDPAISKTDDATTWNIVWQRETAPGVHYIAGARVGWSGAIVSPTFAMASGNVDARHPTVSGPIQGTDRYMIALENLQSAGWSYDVYARLFDGTAILSGDFVGLTGDNDVQPAIESNGRHFLCTWCRERPTGFDVEFAEINPIGDLIGIGDSGELAATPADETTPRLVCHEDSDQPGFSNLYFALWNRAGDIAMAAYVGLEGGHMTPFCSQNIYPSYCPCGLNGGAGGCPNSVHASGATLSGSGFSSTVNDTATLEFADMPPNVSCLLFQGITTQSFVFSGDGSRCTGTPTIRFPLRHANSAGAAGYGAAYGDTPISVRGGIPYVGGGFNYQVWYRDPANFCTPATNNYSNALYVNWTP